MHKLASSVKMAKAARRRRRGTAGASGTPVFRRAQQVDVLQLCALVNTYAAEKLLLPRTSEQVALDLDNYVVAADAGGRVLACAAVHEYSPSLAEITSVAVLRSACGQGLGSRAVAAVEQVARSRGFAQVFAMSLADRFFRSLGYEETPLDGFPEKLSRYAQIAAEGVEIVPRTCFRKELA
ncbi:MAG: GNAT family N-acetyltransferase [Gemmatimonadales bacterium]